MQAQDLESSGPVAVASVRKEVRTRPLWVSAARHTQCDVIREEPTGSQHCYRLETGSSREVSCHTAWLTWHSPGRTTLSLLPASLGRQLVIGKMGMPKSERSPKSL